MLNPLTDVIKWLTEIHGCSWVNAQYLCHRPCVLKYMVPWFTLTDTDFFKKPKV